MGCNPPGSYELSLMQSAATKKIPIEGLETVASQMDALNKTPLEKQTEGIYQMALKIPTLILLNFKAWLQHSKPRIRMRCMI